MSYILDALRKSEQQRQSIQPETVVDRILVNQPTTHANHKKWLVLLFLVNLLVLAYFFGFHNKKQIATIAIDTVKHESSFAQTTPETVVTTPEISPAPMPAQEIVSNTPVASASPEENIPPASPSISDMMAGNQATLPDQKPNVSAAIDKKTNPVKKQPQSKANRNRALPNSAANTMAQYHRPKYSQRSYMDDSSEEPSANAESDPPKLTINVFSYAPKPEDRFVMINMSKYKVGQLIKGGIKLKEIHSDHIVLQKGHSTFKLDRP